MVVTINSLTIPCCSSEWWPELTEFLAILSILPTFIKATTDTARRSLVPAENTRCKTLPRKENLNCVENAPLGGIAAPPIGPVTEESLNHEAHVVFIY